jgi:hypothetical protein
MEQDSVSTIIPLLTLGKTFQSLQVAGSSVLHYFVWKFRGGRLVIPAALVKVITQVLLVEALLAPTRLILVCRPESGRIWGKDFIYQSKLITYCAELKLGIGDDYASLTGNGCPFLI